jgi:hypothetical protein
LQRPVDKKAKWIKKEKKGWVTYSYLNPNLRNLGVSADEAPGPPKRKMGLKIVFCFSQTWERGGIAWRQLDNELSY